VSGKHNDHEDALVRLANAAERIGQVLDGHDGNLSIFEMQQRTAFQMQSVAGALKRIADALERAHPPGGWETAETETPDVDCPGWEPIGVAPATEDYDAVWYMRRPRQEEQSDG
jgi:hypothetical protein